MKILKLVRRHYAIVGISPNQRTQKDPFSIRILFGFLLFGCLISSQFMYVFHVAHGFIEYVDGICSTFGSIIIFVSYAAIVFRKIPLFENIHNIEMLMDMSKLFLNCLFMRFYGTKIRNCVF